jgi:hypothetical protein
MKRLYSVVFISLLTTSSIAGDVANSFEQAAALAAAQDKRPAAQNYHQRDLMPYYEQKYLPIFQSCLASTDHPDTSPFSFVVAIGTDGRVLRLYTDHETNVFACVRQTLQKDEFPRPPVSPFYMRVSMSFANAGADDASSSFKQAAALGDAEDKDPATWAYVQRDLNPYYKLKYSSVFQSCLASTDHPDTSPFTFIAAIGKDGRVVQLYIDHETNIFACVRQTLQKDEFPHPPVSPYYFHTSMSFSK